jgi:hypothetical protein
MGELTYNPAFVEDPDAARLLPVEEIVEGKPVKRKYMFQVSALPEEIHKGTFSGLKMKFATVHNGNTLYVDEMFSYDPNYIGRFANFIKLLGMPIKGLTQEDFVGRQFWATVKRDSYKSTKEFEEDGVTGRTILQNRIDTFLRVATPEEVSGDTPADAPPF